MKRVICSPGSYLQGQGELSRLAEYYQTLGRQGAYLIVSRSAYAVWKDRIDGGVRSAGIPYEVHLFGGECCQSEIDKHLRQIGNCDVVLGVGGGKVLDTAKAAAHFARKPVIIAPTIASTDAPCSRVAVLYTEQGAFSHYLSLSSNPNMVVVDTLAVAQAPVRFLMAGVGDALATCYEAEAAARSGAVTMAGGCSTRAALALAQLCRDTLLQYGRQAKADAERGTVTDAVENVVESNTYLSGVGFESGGLAAAHAIHNGLTVLGETHKLLHGEKVAFGTLVQLVLERRDAEDILKIIAFCRDCGLPTTLEELGLAHAGDERLMQAASASCAPEETMGNMPFPVTPEDVLSAMKRADQIAQLAGMLKRG